MASLRRDSTQECARVRQMLEYVVSHLRERQPQLDDGTRLLFGRARETLIALQREFAEHSGRPFAAAARSGTHSSGTSPGQRH